MEDEAKGSKKSRYSKRPWWYWLVIYLVIGSLAYLVIFYFIKNKAGSPYEKGGTTTSVPY